MSYQRIDYPLAETQPQEVKGLRGKSLVDLTIDELLSGNVTMEDLRITPEALQAQAQIARDSGRSKLASNFERAAELVSIPQEVIMEIYELLRPGRATSKSALLDAADLLRNEYSAPGMAAFIEEAADAYETRGLFKYRF